MINSNHAIHKINLSQTDTNNINVLNAECGNKANRKNPNDLVNVLLDQIEFFKGELKSKDSIIKILLNDHASVTRINTNRPKGTRCNYNKRYSKNVESNKSGKIKQKINCKERCLNKDQNSDDGFEKAGVKGSNRRTITIMGDSML